MKQHLGVNFSRNQLFAQEYICYGQRFIRQRCCEIGSPFIMIDLTSGARDGLDAIFSDEPGSKL